MSQNCMNFLYTNLLQLRRTDITDVNYVRICMNGSQMATLTMMSLWAWTLCMKCQTVICSFYLCLSSTRTHVHYSVRFLFKYNLWATELPTACRLNKTMNVTRRWVRCIESVRPSNTHGQQKSDDMTEGMKNADLKTCDWFILLLTSTVRNVWTVLLFNSRRSYKFVLLQCIIINKMFRLTPISIQIS